MGAWLKNKIHSFGVFILVMSCSVSFAEAIDKKDRSYFAIDGEVFFGHYTPEKGLKNYKASYSSDDDKIKNKLAKKFKEGIRYSGLDANNTKDQYVIEKIYTMPWYECMPECGPSIEFSKDTAIPRLLWTGEISVVREKPDTCEISNVQNMMIDKHISKVVGEYFKPYFSTNRSGEYSHKIIEKSCRSFKSGLIEFTEINIPIQVAYIPHQEITKNLSQYTPVFTFRIDKGKLKAMSNYLSTECCGYHTGGNIFIDSVLSIDDHDVVLYKWVGLESSGYSMMPVQDFLKEHL
jgi:hypothetical protein